jgi:membrane fusion protein, heavy metal efflux system
MSLESRVNVRWTVLAAIALGLLAVGAGAAYVSLRSSSSSPGSSGQTGLAEPRPASAPPGASASAAGPSTALSDVVVTLSKEAVAQAGITFATAVGAAPAGGLRAPGIVEPNAYKQVVVTPIVSGRVTRVAADLGAHVQRGQMLAQIFSPELAESQTRYISARAELQAHEQELARTERLVKIGAASRQELERIHAGHIARRADLQGAASRLQLLGLSDRAIEDLDSGKTLEATVSIPAPIAGVVTERSANVGLNVDQATRLFMVVDLSSVWVVVDVYEKDFAHVRVNMPARVTTTAYPDVLEGRVDYIDPQVRAETRTAKVRIEVPNARQNLRIGMYAEAIFGGGGGSSTPMIPRSAVQNVGDRTVVYLVNPKEPGRFVERDVRLGVASGPQVPVLSGIQAGDVVVGEGSFHVRAERERLGLRPSAPAPPTSAGPLIAQEQPAAQAAKVVVGDQGYDPATVTLRAGVPARVTFVRTSDKTCGTEVLFPSLDIKRALPLNAPVVIEFTPAKAGEIAFLCGMSMLKGVVVVR